MNLQQLQYFKAIAETGNITQASELLHVSQPALSMSISSLEAELGIPLFESRKRPLKLNSYGTVFLHHISAALLELDLARSEIKRLSLTSGQTLHLSSTYSLSSSLMPGIVRSFQAVNPDVVIHMQQAPNMELLLHVSEMKTDFIFSRIAPASIGYDNLNALCLYREELVLLISCEHPLSHRDSLTLDELRTEDFICFHESTGFNLIATELFKHADFVPDIRYEVYDNSTCISLVSANMGIALVAPTPLYDTQMVRQIRLDTPYNKESCVYLVWNPDGERHTTEYYGKFLKHVCGLYPNSEKKE